MAEDEQRRGINDPSSIDWKALEQALSISQPFAIEARDPSDIENLLEQRHKQRHRLFDLCERLAYYSFFLLCVLLLAQALGKTHLHPEVSLFSNDEIKTISISVFGQIVAVVIVIASSLWNEKDFLGFYKHRKEDDKKT